MVFGLSHTNYQLNNDKMYCRSFSIAELFMSKNILSDVFIKTTGQLVDHKVASEFIKY